MTRLVTSLTLLVICSGAYAQLANGADYNAYHKQVTQIEAFIAAERSQDALDFYEGLFAQYDFVFVRDYKIASQLALYLGYEEKAMALLIRGVRAGWTLTSIKKNDFLNGLRKSEYWDLDKNRYDSLRTAYESGLNQDVRKQVAKMFAKDQRKALGALFTFGSKGQDRYAERKFAPHSEKQIAALLQIIDGVGFPGEQLIGNGFWASTILSHHNSISTDYNRDDTLYTHLRPSLLEARKKGQLSAFGFALIDEWSRATIDIPTEPSYGILDGPRLQDLKATNERRAAVFLRPIEVHNRLVEVEQKTGMRFYLRGNPWEPGKIELR